MANKFEVTPKKINTNDRILFMTAYDISEIKKLSSLKRKKEKASTLMQKYHINAIVSKDIIITKNEKFSYKTEYDFIEAGTTFDFGCDDRKNKEIFRELNWIMSLKNSFNNLLDDNLFCLEFCFDLEPFLVKIGNIIFKINPIAFIINGTFFIVYELSKAESNLPLELDEIYGRSNNYNIISVNSISYSGFDNFEKSNKRISDIIYENIITMMEEVSETRFYVDYNYIHSIYVCTNKKLKINEFFKKVVGAEDQSIKTKNISTTKSFSYFSAEFLGVCRLNKPNVLGNALFDCLLLESIKMHIYVKLIFNYETTETLTSLLDKQIYLEHICYPKSVPIITCNLIENVKETFTYRKYKSAIEHKINALEIYQEREQNKNEKLLNILLYILAFLGSFEALEILENRFNLPFECGLILIVLFFGVLGAYWFIKGNHKW